MFLRFWGWVGGVMAREGDHVDINVGVSLRTEIEVYSCTCYCLYHDLYVYTHTYLLSWDSHYLELEKIV